MKWTAAVLLFLGSAFIVACGGGGSGGAVTETNGDDSTDTMATEVSFQEQIQPIFDLNCALVGCHVEPDPMAGMSLEAGLSYDNLVNQPTTQSVGIRVIPGDGANSELYLRVSGETLGTRMPKDRPPLSESDQNLIKDWIDQGAPRN